MIFHGNLGDKTYQIDIEKQQGVYLIKINDNSYKVESRQISSKELLLNIQGKIYDLIINSNSRSHKVDIGPWSYQVELLTTAANQGGIALDKGTKSGKITITTPMPGKVIKILKDLNEPVKKGEGVIVVEAMKMENELKSPKKGTISEIKVSQGTAVESGEILMVIE